MWENWYGTSLDGAFSDEKRNAITMTIDGVDDVELVNEQDIKKELLKEIDDEI